jgi:hypothetical protein
MAVVGRPKEAVHQFGISRAVGAGGSGAAAPLFIARKGDGDRGGLAIGVMEGFIADPGAIDVVPIRRRDHAGDIGCIQRGGSSRGIAASEVDGNISVLSNENMNRIYEEKKTPKKFKNKEI